MLRWDNAGSPRGSVRAMDRRCRPEAIIAHAPSTRYACERRITHCRETHYPFHSFGTHFTKMYRFSVQQSQSSVYQRSDGVRRYDSVDDLKLSFLAKNLRISFPPRRLESCILPRAQACPLSLHHLGVSFSLFSRLADGLIPLQRFLVVTDQAASLDPISPLASTGSVAPRGLCCR
jgi:hypothetical protein